MASKRKTTKTTKMKTKTKMKKAVKKRATKRPDVSVGFTNEIYLPIQVGRSYYLLTTDNKLVPKVKGVSKARIKEEADSGMAVRAFIKKDGKTSWRSVEASEFDSVKFDGITSSVMMVAPDKNSVAGETKDAELTTHDDITQFIHTEALELKPKYLFMDDLKWKYLIRSAIRAKNILMVGPTGCGKTLAARSVMDALKRPHFYFNLGASQDPRATLIGNTHFNKDTGTFFSESAFVKAIKTPYAVILLDEISRAHPEAWNILMTVLDQGQRYLRLDEAEDSPIVKVADGVTFIATANIGNEYTSTRVMDRALSDRFVTIEMDLLEKKQELSLLKLVYPNADSYYMNALAEIAAQNRKLAKDEDGKLSSVLSTRVNLEAAGLIYDGFSLVEAAEIAILPYFSEDGGVDSERVFMRQLIQKYVKADSPKVNVQSTSTSTAPPF